MKGKRANTAVSIAILVVMILALTGAVLFIFYINNSKSSILTADARFVGKSSFEKEKSEFIISKIAEEDFKKAIKDAGSKEIGKVKDKFEQIFYADILLRNLEFDNSDILKKNIKDGKSRLFIEGNRIVFDSGEIIFSNVLAVSGDEKVILGDFTGLTSYKDLKQNLAVSST